MFVRNLRDNIDNPGPPGCSRPNPEDRMPVAMVFSGDTWNVTAVLRALDGSPASPDNSRVEFVLAENQFACALWTGTWLSGIFPDENRPGLVRVKIPREVTRALRRGSYMFSARVSDPMRYDFETQIRGYFLVEYAPTSDQRSIPYRDGTSENLLPPNENVDGESEETGNDTGSVAIRDDSTGKYHRLSAVRDPETGEVDIKIGQNGISP